MTKSALSALEQIKQIQEKAESEIAKLKQSAVSEIAARMAAAKQVLREIEMEYEELTGKNVRGEKIASSIGGGTGTRRRMSASEKGELIATVKATLTKDTGLKMSELVERSGANVGSVRNALKEVPHKTTGNKATTLYFAK